jgi:hypothetical protein
MGMLRLSSKLSPVELWYNAINDAYGPGYSPVAGSHQDASNYARARAFARADAAAQRAGNNRNGATALELIPLLEADYEISPAATATITQRQAAIAAAQALPGGASFSNVAAVLASVLGTDFVAYRPLATTEASTYPVWPGATATLKSNPTLGMQPVKMCVLTEPVGQTIPVNGEPTLVGYTDLQPAPKGIDASGSLLALSAWASTTSYTTGQILGPQSPNGFAYVCTTAGTSGTLEPSFPRFARANVTDGSVVWTCIGTTQSVGGSLLAYPSPWSASIPALAAIVVQPDAQPNGLAYQCTTAGVTGATEPTWPTVVGQTVVDGTAVWECVSVLAPTPGETDLAAGDVVVVQGENTCLSEVVTVIATVGTGSQRYFYAPFQYAHDAGATVTTMDWPYAWSTQRFAFVVVSAAAAVDPVRRNLVHTWMRKLARGVSQWAIVPAGVPIGGAGESLITPFAFGTSPLGTAPLGNTFEYWPTQAGR